jgi:competence protein ComFC
MDEFICPNCRDEGFSFTCAVSVVRSQTVIRDLVHRLKYSRELWLSRVLGQILHVGLSDPRFEGIEFDAIVPVPLHSKRERERDYNQSALLAQHLSAASGIPLREVLLRQRYTETQTRLNRKLRRQNLRNAFLIRKNVDVTDQSLLLIDDVLTTGATLDACAAVLIEHGAASVHSLTLARG